MTFERGQRVTVKNRKHGTFSGQIAVLSTDGQTALAVLLDDPIKAYTKQGLLITGGLALQLLDGEYKDFWDQTWTITGERADYARQH